MFARHFDEKAIGPVASDELTPDLLVLGLNHIGTQSVLLGPDGIKGALFFDLLYWSGLRIEPAKGTAYGLGLVSPLQAVNRIQFLPIDWGETLNTGFASVVFGKT